MADKKKKSVKMRDLKPSKDAKGGGGGARNTATRNLNTAGAKNTRIIWRRRNRQAELTEPRRGPNPQRGLYKN